MIVQLGHSVRNGNVHVHGRMQLKRLVLPFSYKVPANVPFDHDAHLASLEAKGRVWEEKVDQFTAWRDLGTDKVGAHVVTIIDCTMYPESANDWRLLCIFESEGQRHEIRLRYNHPALAMDIAALKTLVAQRASSSVASAAHASVHKERLNAIAQRVQAEAPGVPGSLGTPRRP